MFWTELILTERGRPPLVIFCLAISRVTVTSTVDNLTGYGAGFMPAGFVFLTYLESAYWVCFPIP
jgi:hypothetical protein